METFINVVCPRDGNVQLHADEVTFYVDIAGNAAHEYYCPHCGAIRVHVWDTTKPARRIALALKEEAAGGITVHQVASLTRTVEQTLHDFGCTFAGEPLLTSDGMWSELDRYAAADRQAQA